MGGTVTAINAVVGSRAEQVAVAPGDWTEHLGSGVLRLDRRTVALRLAPDLGERRRRRMHIAVGGVPQHRLVVERVVAHAAGGGGAEQSLQMGDPGRLEGGGRRDRGVGRIVADDLAALAVALAGVRVDLGVLRGVAGAVARVRVGPALPPAGAELGIELRTVLGHREAPVPRLAAVDGGPADGGNRDQRLPAGAADLADEAVRIVGLRRSVVDVEPVRGRVVLDALPVVTSDRIAAPAAQGQLERSDLRRGAEIHPVGFRVDQASVQVHVDADIHGRRRTAAGRGDAHCQDDSLHVALSVDAGTLPGYAERSGIPSQLRAASRAPAAWKRKTPRWRRLRAWRKSAPCAGQPQGAKTFR